VSEHGEGRRKFLKRAGSAAAAAPAMAAVISASSKAAHAGGHYGPRGNNGWGNGFDGENPGSFQGGGVSQGGPGAGIPQNQSKPNTGGGR
jgi:hypothetical protein